MTGLAIAAWLIVAMIIVASEYRMRLDVLPRELDSAANQSLSVVVALRDEAPRAAEMLRLLLAQDHPDFEVVLVDDRSTDGTGEILRAAAGADPRVALLRVDETPGGWQGRLFAQSVGVAAGTREWLLFLSADQRLTEPDLLRRIVMRAADEPAGAIAVMGRFAGEQWWDRWWLRPILNSPVVLGTVLSLQHWGRSVWLIGALTMRRTTYHQIGGAEAARDCGNGLFEDLGWSRAFALPWNGRALTLVCPELHDVSNWESPAEVHHGLARWVAGVFTYRRGGWVVASVLVAAVAVMLVATAAVAADVAGRRMPSLASVVLSSIVPLLGLSYSRRDERSSWVAIAFYAIAVLAITSLVGGIVARWRNAVVWRGERMRLVGNPARPSA
ncbi:MAG: glycosyltransferase family A protein [Proteobacteria bacterium]|nr:glycosyltransferase family A protein [Pseudomonadota bacterium]